ncbi:uncharacterized protein L969DRAFT_93661 [Mixia osmundae IAM 14324]|uniref:Ataxin-10 homolog n=1 Tax=Mixia osmundae (strain CBS 9802 / IAM 14324 / JCM 22182 / KY 12970) TaxID=764103 RepID=G7E980_MIXOS|nr:uncharacterized protein L969DRAFT_93661 [Mixia osmundae IAM 14324]KEI39821.1 hypothetical protein L969DRAFT_93661 [Mixia osmundae IAM 14324]GAA99199.1 hypothetical protein E5Q_05891 [Mixia osmundae IAM 14324]
MLDDDDAELQQSAFLSADFTAPVLPYASIIADLEDKIASIATNTATRERSRLSKPVVFEQLQRAWQRLHDDLIVRNEAGCLPFGRALALFTRNLAPGNQIKLFPLLPHDLLYHSSSALRLQDLDYQPFTRATCQLLANILRGQNELVRSYWPRFLASDLASRLLATPDEQLRTTVLVLLGLLVDESHERIGALAGPRGKTTMAKVLDMAESLHDTPAYSLVHSLVGKMIKSSFLAQIYDTQATPVAIIVEAQVQLLKIAHAEVAALDFPVLDTITETLMQQFLRLSSAAEDAFASQQRQLTDVLLLEGLWFLLQSFTVICLKGQMTASETLARSSGRRAAEFLLKVTVFKQYILSTEQQDHALDGALQAFADIQKAALSFLATSADHHASLVQPAVREAGALPILLSLCGDDPHAPFLRENAILAMRFLLQGSPENQAIIRQLGSMQTFG